MVKVDNLGFSVGKKWLLKNLSYEFHPGKIHLICGPNGAGKSTLMKLLSLEMPPSEGTVLYNGVNTNQKNKHAYAMYRGILSQQVDITFPLSANEVIMMGRYPHFKIAPSKRDLEICDEVIFTLRLQSFRERNFLTLSGGEKQRVQFARVITQIWEHRDVGNRILLLDEPISALDLRYQFEFLDHLKKFLDDRTIVIAILHDLNLILNYGDEVLLLNEGLLVDSGKPENVLKKENIKDVFHVDTSVYPINNHKFLWVNHK